MKLKNLIKESDVISQQEMARKFIPKLVKSQQYNKFAKVWAMPARVGQRVDTITSDGKETTNVAKENDFVIKAQTKAGEQYIIPAATVSKRYKPTGKQKDGWVELQAVGSVNGFEWTGDTITFEASWGETMPLKKGDMLVTPDGKEVYRIARKEFQETYK